MHYGLTDKDLKVIQQVAQQFSVIEQIVLFGSRAKGHYKTGSDVNLAIKGSGIDYDTLVGFAEILNEETPLPYFFDVVHYEELTELHLIKHIDRIGILLWQCPKANRLHPNKGIKSNV